MDYSRFQKIYANLPAKVRGEIVAVVDSEPYTWSAANLEISNGTKLGKTIMQKLMIMEVI